MLLIRYLFLCFICINNVSCQLNDSFEYHKIVGGYQTRPGQYPWVINMQTVQGTRPFCGGALLNSLWILTASHCMVRKKPSDLLIHLGDHDINILESDEKVEKVCGIYNYPQSFNDIALMLLCKEVKFNKKIKPIALPAPDTVFKHGEPSIVAGWGVTAFGNAFPVDVQRAVVVKIVKLSICRRTFHQLNDNNVCAGSEGKDSCQGDSGGPLWMEIKKTPTVIGVVSRGDGCGKKGSPGIYTRVSSYYNWIIETMARHNPSEMIVS